MSYKNEINSSMIEWNSIQSLIMFLNQFRYTDILADVVRKSLLNYKLNLWAKVSYTNDNCNLMVCTAEILGIF